MKLEDKESLNYKIRQLVWQAAQKVVGKGRVDFEEVVLEHPENPAHGDYSTNIAMRIHSRKIRSGHAGSGGEVSPYNLAVEIANAFREQGLPEFIAKIEVAPPGFLNIWLQNEYLISQLAEVLKKKEKYGEAKVLAGKRILLEHTSPNPQTTIMLGHLRNNFLGMSCAKILEFLGAKVVKDCVVNDRGVHICRALWGYLVFGQKKSGLTKTELKNFKAVSDAKIKKIIAKKKWQELLETWAKKKSNWLTYKDLKLKPDHANLCWYVLGSRAYELSPKVRQQVKEILQAWEAEDKGALPAGRQVWQIWRLILGWSAAGYSQTYKRVGSVHDWVWHESDHYKQGKEIVSQGLKKGVFRQSEGALVTNLEKYGLPDTVVVKSDGTALYITQDLALTKLKISKFPSDLYIWCIGEEQNLYFKQLFAVCEQLGLEERNKFFHLSYALINFKGGGKMATRRGDVVIADEILDELQSRALEVIKSSNQKLRGKMSLSQLKKLAEKVAVGAIKYSLLKFSRETTIYFDINESLALEGNSAPYLQYTYARTQSVIRKSAVTIRDRISLTIPDRYSLNEEELALLRTIYKFPEVVLEAAGNFAPNLICNYLFDLAEKFNLFYNKWPILKPESYTSEESRLPPPAGGSSLPPSEVENTRNFRLALTAAVGQVIKNGLDLLGIETPEKM